MPNNKKTKKNKKQKKPKNRNNQTKPSVQAQAKQLGILESIGGIAGGYLGGPVGAMIGSKAGDLLSRITGVGDYSVDKNDLVKGNTVPTFRATSEGVEIAHREFILDIVGSTAFSNASLDINPGLATTFPWLSTIAQQFEEYDMMGLVFEYRPSSGSAVSSTSAALGVVVYATDYNVLAPDFANKQQMESYEFSCSTVPNAGMIHPIECAPQSTFLNNMYVRSGATPSSADQRMYDIGSFQYATQGMQSVYTCGELWVSYHVKLKKPRISPYGLAQFAHIYSSAVTTATAAAPLGTTGGVLSTSSNLLGASVGSVATTKFKLTQPGSYWITMNIFCGNNNIAAIPTLALGSNITATNLLMNANNSAAIASYTAGGTYAVFSGLVKVVTAGSSTLNELTIGGLTGMTGGNVDVIITSVPNNVN